MVSTTAHSDLGRYFISIDDFLYGQASRLAIGPSPAIFSIVGLPIILAGVLYYLLNPLVDWLEKRFRVRRTWTIIGLFIVVVALLALGIIAIIPTIRDQTLSIINDWPNYWKNASTEVNRWLNDPQLSSIRDQLESWNTDLSKPVSGRFSKYLTGTVTSLTGVFSTVTTVIIGLITMPFILFTYCAMVINYRSIWLSLCLPKRAQDS